MNMKHWLAELLIDHLTTHIILTHWLNIYSKHVFEWD